MSRLIISPVALADLRNIWDFVALEDATSADRLLDAFFRAFELIANLPGIGHRHESTPGLNLLCWPVRGSWLLFDRQQDDVLEIVRVVSRRRDLQLLS